MVVVNSVATEKAESVGGVSRAVRRLQGCIEFCGECFVFSPVECAIAPRSGG